MVNHEIKQWRLKSMKKTSKKIIGGLMAAVLLATVGAIIVSASPGFLSELTDEQKAELKDLRDTLRNEGATCNKTREAIQEKLESYGIKFPTREEMLDEQINKTQQRLDILLRIKELIKENPDITQEEINEIIQEEFNLEYPNGMCEGRAFGHGFGRGFHRGSCCPFPNEESEK
jgi:hypothetical protein